MYVCLCHGVTDRAITQAARDGINSFAALQQRTGVSTCCGACREQAEDVFASACVSEAGATMPAIAAVGQWCPAAIAS
jgi:bacterioferritin-associated ferredoxin